VNQSPDEGNQPAANINTGERFTFVDMHRTYTGLLDDVMIRYSEEFLSEEFFNKMIVKNIFFGGGLYINDGYLVNHPIARKNLYNEKSLLRIMIDTGFIRVLTRTKSRESLSQMPNKMADQGVESFQRLVNSAEWHEFRPVWNRVSESVYSLNNVRSWPDRDMSVGFTKLMRDRAFATEEPRNLGIANVDRDEWLRIRDRFLASSPERGGPRDKLEKAALSILSEARPNLVSAMNDVMTVGNQCYHYNFGLALTAEEDNGVAVDTTIGAAFDELLQVRQIERGQLEDIPILRLPTDLPFDQGELFLDILRTSTDVGQAKLNYLSSMQNLITGLDLNYETLRDNLVQASKEYVATVLDLLSVKFGKYAFEASYDEYFTLAKGDLDRINAAAAPTAGIAIEIQRRYKEKGLQFLTDRFKLKDVTEEYDDRQVIRFGDIRPQVAALIRPQIAALAFDEDEAKRFIDDIPPAPRF